MMHFVNNPIYPLLSAVLSTWTESETSWDDHALLVRPSKTHQNIWKIIFVFGADEYRKVVSSKASRFVTHLVYYHTQNANFK